MQVIMNVSVEGIEESDVPALKEAIADHILQLFPDVVVAIEVTPEGGQVGKG